MSFSIHSPRSPKVRATLYLSEEVLDQARNAVVHLAGHPVRLTLTNLLENALRVELQRLKDEFFRGQDFPPEQKSSKAVGPSRPDRRPARHNRAQPIIPPD